LIYEVVCLLPFTTSARNIRYPKYEEWNFEVQQAIGTRNSISLNYVGNHGYDLSAENLGLNAYCDPTVCAPSLGATSFVGLPSAPPDARFSTITEVGNYGVSNYNGLTASFTRRASNSRVPSPGAMHWMTFPTADSCPSVSLRTPAFSLRRTPST